MLESLEGKRGEVRFGRHCRPSRASSASRPSSTTSFRSRACRSSWTRAPRSIATSASGGRAGRCRSSWRATSSAADSSRRRSASRCGSCSTTTAAARASGRPIRAVQVGGPLGAYMPESQFDTPLDYEAFTSVGALLGHGGIVVFDDTVDMAQMARYAMEFCALESCGKCTPCRIGSTRGVEVIDRIMPGSRPRPEPGAARRTVRYDDPGIAVRTRRNDALPGAERAQALS